MGQFSLLLVSRLPNLGLQRILNLNALLKAPYSPDLIRRVTLGDDARIRCVMVFNQLLIASNNEHKLLEFRRLISNQSIALVSPREIGLELEVDETGETFEDNARLKAHSFAQASGMYALADDSGIEVDALGGRPGVKSARYGGSGIDDSGRVRLLLRELNEVPWEQRTCRYRVSLVLASPLGEELSSAGSCEGIVGHEPFGTNGFGYDPIFYLSGSQKMMAELLPAQKDMLSHRGHAVRALFNHLTDWIR